jgi:hypothetical protein
MANKIKPKRSYTANAVPTTSDLDTNELAINWADLKAFTKNAAGNIVSVSLGGGGSSSVVTASTVAGFPATGTAGILYVALDTSKVFQWQGAYLEVGAAGGSQWSSVPASATATGTAGQIAYDLSNFYICVSTNSWTRVSLPSAVTKISGLQLWLDASDPWSLFDATTGGSAVAADGAVARWEDKSGNLRHATQSTSGYRPLRKTSVQNGKDAVRFDGSNDAMTISGTQSSFKFLHSTQATVFWVAKFGNSSDPNAQYGVMSNGGASGSEIGYLCAFEDRSAASTNNGFISSAIMNSSGDRAWLNRPSNVITPQTYVVYEEQIDAANATASLRSVVRINGVAATSTNTLTNTPSTANATYDMTLGSVVSGGSNSSPMLGDLCEIIIYNSLVSYSDRASIVSYLMTKWGIA